LENLGVVTNGFNEQRKEKEKEACAWKEESPLEDQGKNFTQAQDVGRLPARQSKRFF